MTNPSKQSTDLVLDMFEDWYRVYGSKLKERQTLDLRTAKLWAVALKGFELTLGEFKTAYAKSITLEWPPTAPADFVKLARGDKQSQYPNTQTAFEIACRNCGMRGDINRDWQHPVILETANRIGWGVLAQATNGYIKHFEQVYLSVISEHQKGADFTIPEARRIEAPKPAKLDNDSELSQQWERLKSRFKRGETA